MSSWQQLLYSTGLRKLLICTLLFFFIGLDTPLLFTSWLQPSHNALCVLAYILSVHLSCLFDRSHSSLLRTFGIFCDLYLQIIAPINLWHKALIWGYFLKCNEGPFLRPLRSKDDQCSILRLQPWNFVVISESFAAKLKKVRQIFLW